MEFSPGIMRDKPPMDGGLGSIALPLQGPDFPAASGLVGDTPPVAEASRIAKLDRRHHFASMNRGQARIEPTTMLRCVVKLEPFYDTPGLRGGEGPV